MRSPGTRARHVAAPATHLEPARPPSLSGPWNMSPGASSPAAPRFPPGPTQREARPPGCPRPLDAIDASHATAAYRSAGQRPRPTGKEAPRGSRRARSRLVRAEAAQASGAHTGR